jgi:hypothetical protein
MNAIIILVAMLSAQPTTDSETLTAVAKAERDVAIAQKLQSSCKGTKQCNVAKEMVAAAEAELTSARTLAGAAVVAAEPDPFAPPSTAEPFEGVGFPLPQHEETEIVKEGLATTELIRVEALLGDLGKQ